MQTTKTLIRLGGCPSWSESSLSAQVILLVLSWVGSNWFLATWIYKEVFEPCEWLALEIDKLQGVLIRFLVNDWTLIKRRKEMGKVHLFTKLETLIFLIELISFCTRKHIKTMFSISDYSELCSSQNIIALLLPRKLLILNNIIWHLVSITEQVM